MNWKKEWKPLALIAAVFLAFYYFPIEQLKLDNAAGEALALAKWYAREHVLLCLIPAFFIAGAISVFIGQASVMKYLGAQANKVLAYGVASVSGTILAVCSCTILPLFAGIYRMGAGLGPATAFLYSGPAINVLAMILTTRVLGLELGIARALGAVVFGVVIGLLMNLIFRDNGADRAPVQPSSTESDTGRSLWQNAAYLGAMVVILVFANWGKTDETSGVWYALYSLKWEITALFAAALGVMLIMWFEVAWWKIVAVAVPTTILAFVFSHEPVIPFAVGVIGLSVITGSSKGETGDWFAQSWGFARQILPLLLLGVLVAGLLLGRPGHEGLIPAAWINSAVGGNSLGANAFASIAGAFMYFATLTEVPILQGLIGNGMGKGPALALLLAGPALSLPNMLVIRSVLGTLKTVVYVALVVVMATVTGLIYGMWF